MGSPIKPGHNWTKQTFGRCGSVHMDQLRCYWFNFAPGKWRDEKITGLLNHFEQVERALYPKGINPGDLDGE